MGPLDVHVHRAAEGHTCQVTSYGSVVTYTETRPGDVDTDKVMAPANGHTDRWTNEGVSGSHSSREGPVPTSKKVSIILIHMT